MLTDPFLPDYSPTSWTATQQYIVFVHGFHTNAADATNAGETMFKRLWQRGYKGRFVRFYWPTYTNPKGFNDSEYLAWLFGGSLKSFMASLPAGYSKNLISHSLGGVVCGSALKKGMSIDNYASLNSTVPAICYDTNEALYQWNYTTPDDDTDAFTRTLAYRGQLSSVSTNIINFYFPDDPVLNGLWARNNHYTKPQPLTLSTGYFYHPQASSGEKLGISYLTVVGRFVATQEEAMGYVDQSRATATGAEGRTAGAVSSSIDMDNYNFGTDHDWLFDLDIQKAQPAYYDILSSFGISQNYLSPQRP